MLCRKLSTGSGIQKCKCATEIDSFLYRPWRSNSTQKALLPRGGGGEYMSLVLSSMEQGLCKAMYSYINIVQASPGDTQINIFVELLGVTHQLVHNINSPSFNEFFRMTDKPINEFSGLRHAYFKRDHCL